MRPRVACQLACVQTLYSSALQEPHPDAETHCDSTYSLSLLWLQIISPLSPTGTCYASVLSIVVRIEFVAGALQWQWIIPIARRKAAQGALHKAGFCPLRDERHCQDRNH